MYCSYALNIQLNSMTSFPAKQTKQPPVEQWKQVFWWSYTSWTDYQYYMDNFHVNRNSK